jgi:hypothetical protein
MDNIIINKEGDFKNETISSIPLGINNIMINNDKKFDLKKGEISNIKPMLSRNSNTNTILIPDGKKVRIKPILNKKVPLNTFSMMANPKKNISGETSSDEDSMSSGASVMSESDELLSNNSKSTRNSNIQQNQYQEEDEEDDEDEDNEDENPDDYSSIENGNNNQNKNRKNTYRKNTEESYEDEDEEDDEEGYDEDDSPPVKQKTYEEIQQEKQKMLFNLERLQKQGYPPSKRYSMASSYEDMQFEHDRLKKQRDVEKSIKFSRKILMALVSGVEFLNNKFDPFDIRLDGWSENIMENVNDYDEVFEELHDKYSDSVKMAPELKLIAMVAGSGFMFHLTNSLFKSASPKLGDILKQNPDIMRNISEAAAKNMGNTINQEFGQNDFIGNMMKEGINMKMNQQRGPMPQNRMFQQSPPSQQPKMSGPVGIDDLLNELGSGPVRKQSNDNDEISLSSNDSITIKSSGKRSKNSRKGGIQLDLR